jgi:Domain of unknown function (DUF4072)
MTIHHLVVQSPGLTVEHAEQIAALAQAQGVARISATAARLLDVQHEMPPAPTWWPGPNAMASTPPSCLPA